MRMAADVSATCRQLQRRKAGGSQATENCTCWKSQQVVAGLDAGVLGRWACLLARSALQMVHRRISGQNSGDPERSGTGRWWRAHRGWSDSSRCSRKPAARFILAAHLTGERSQDVQQHEDQVRHPPLGRHDACARCVHESTSSTCYRKQECAGASRRGRSVLQRWGQPCRAGI